MPQPSIKERQRQVREDAILEAAHALLGQQGYAEMSMDNLAAQLGISKATLYQHFESKEDVAVHVVVRLMQRGEALLAEATVGQPAIGVLECWLRRGLELRMATPSQGMSALPHNITQHPRYQQQNAQMHAQVSALIERAKAEGDADPAVATAIAARMMMRLFRGDYDDFVENKQYTREELSAALVALVMNGLRARSIER
ncbi:MAG: TetR/AcrR family transcriptional regulator [Roseiflexaceae bacterium]|nr:TetR/AcrR family transcriptional regulator [Roseiflexaceae bacterium]